MKNVKLWLRIQMLSDGEKWERMVDKVMLAVSLLLWQPDAICTQCKMTTSVFQINNTMMSPYNIHISYNFMTYNVPSFAYSWDYSSCNFWLNFCYIMQTIFFNVRYCITSLDFFKCLALFQITMLFFLLIRLQ